MYIAWPPEPATQGERRWHLLNRRPRDLNPIPWHRRHGEGKTISLRDVWQAIQEPQRPQVPPRTFPKMQSRAFGRSIWPDAVLAGLERRCQRCRCWHDGHGSRHVLRNWTAAISFTASLTAILRFTSSMIPRSSCGMRMAFSKKIELDD